MAGRSSSSGSMPSPITVGPTSRSGSMPSPITVGRSSCSGSLPLPITVGRDLLLRFNGIADCRRPRPLCRGPVGAATTCSAGRSLLPQGRTRKLPARDTEVAAYGGAGHGMAADGVTGRSSSSGSMASPIAVGVLEVLPLDPKLLDSNPQCGQLASGLAIPHALVSCSKWTASRSGKGGSPKGRGTPS
jgi:hypothetical protein